jgi:membrane protein
MIYRIWHLIRMTFRIWEQANASRMSAAMTYFTMLSLAPLLMIAVAVAGYVYDDQLAEEKIVEQVQVITTPEIAATVAGLIKNAIRPGSGIVASSISLLILFYAASGVFTQLYDTFNEIWQVPLESRTGIRFTVRKRLIGVAMVLIAGILLIGTMMVGSVVSYIDNLFEDSLPTLILWLNLVDRSLSLILMPFVFSVIFWFFPATKMTWGDVWPAGVLTALLVLATRYLLEIYLHFSTASQVYGAAGSLVVLLIWVYMTGLVVFFGASFSRAWSVIFGSRRELSPTQQSELNDAPSAGAGSSNTISLPNASAIADETKIEDSPPLILHRRGRR